MIVATSEVPVAIIGAFAIVAAAAIPPLVMSRRIGKPNGRGNLIEMVGQALDKADRAETAAAEAVATVKSNKADTDRRFGAQDNALHRIETAVRAALIDRGIPGPEA